MEFDDVVNRITNEASVYRKLPNVLEKLVSSPDEPLNSLFKELKQVFDKEADYTIEMLENIAAESKNFDLKVQYLHNIYIFKENLKMIAKLMIDEIWRNQTAKYQTSHSLLNPFVEAIVIKESENEESDGPGVCEEKESKPYGIIEETNRFLDNFSSKGSQKKKGSRVNSEGNLPNGKLVTNELQSDQVSSKKNPVHTSSGLTISHQKSSGIPRMLEKPLRLAGSSKEKKPGLSQKPDPLSSSTTRRKGNRNSINHTKESIYFEDYEKPSKARKKSSYQSKDRRRRAQNQRDLTPDTSFHKSDRARLQNSAKEAKDDQVLFDDEELSKTINLKQLLTFEGYYEHKKKNQGSNFVKSNFVVK